MTSEPFFSKPHGKSFVDIYVTPSYANAYATRDRSAPQGTRVVKPIYKSKGGPVARLTVMMKMAPGYDADEADWWYGVYSPDGKTAMKQGKIKMCINCHGQADDTDYLFGVPK